MTEFKQIVWAIIESVNRFVLKIYDFFWPFLDIWARRENELRSFLNEVLLQKYKISIDDLEEEIGSGVSKKEYEFEYH